MIYVNKDLYGGAHGIAENYKAWSLSGGVGYVCGIDCGCDAFGETICSEVVDTQDGWVVSVHWKGSSASNGVKRLRARCGEEFGVFCY